MLCFPAVIHVCVTDLIRKSLLRWGSSIGHGNFSPFHDLCQHVHVCGCIGCFGWWRSVREVYISVAGPRPPKQSQKLQAPLHTQTQSLPIENFLATVLRLNSIFKRPWVGALFPLISLVVTSCMWRRLSLVRVIKRSLHQRESNPVFCSIWSFRDFRQTHHQNVLGMGFMTCIIQYIYTPVVTLTSTYTF